MRIAVASVNLYSGFTGFMYAQVKKALRPGQSILDCVTHHQHDSEFARQRLLALLDSDPKPVALIAICIKPGPIIVEAFRKAGAPILVVDEEAEGVTTVATDNFACGRIAAQRLLGNGRKTLGIVSGKSQLDGGYSAIHRQKGFRSALAEAGVRFSEDRLIEVQDYSHKDGTNALASFLDRRTGVDGVFIAAGDACAAGLLAAARTRGVKIPDDLAVVSVDDLPMASISDPPLTTVRQPLEAIAREAHRLATEETAQILRRPKRVLLEPTLIERKSG
jgi:DNA-binding LacI/PurR family transcriptional regulator